MAQVIVRIRGIQYKESEMCVLSMLRVILSDPNARNLFMFLVLNLSFAFVELFYGMWTNR